jgi:hypothetical protein
MRGVNDGITDPSQVTWPYEKPDLKLLQSMLEQAVRWADAQIGNHLKAEAIYLAELAVREFNNDPYADDMRFEGVAAPHAFALLEECDGYPVALGKWERAQRYVGVKDLVDRWRGAKNDYASY